MALSITHVLTALIILQYTLRVGDWMDAPTQDLLQQREAQQEREQEKMWLLEETEQRSQDPHGLTQERVLLTACQHWWFWASAKTLFLVFGLYWLPRQRSADSDSCSQRGNSSPDEAEEEEKKEEDGWEDTTDPYDTRGSYQDSG